MNIREERRKTRREIFEDYEGFVEKFKPKKTTDDCMTPEEVYNAVKDWAVKRFNLEGRPIVRPFWPGGDYLGFDYPEGCVVIDNPPFSIFSQIVKDYNEHGVDYFLFAPHLTLFQRRTEAGYIITDADVVYENGAVVNTSFATSMLGDCLIETAPELREAIKEAQQKAKQETKKQLPKYRYPDHLITVSRLSKILRYVPKIQIPRSEAAYCSRLDAQRPLGKNCFGGAFLTSDRVAAELKAADRVAADEVIKFELSQAEQEVVRRLSQTT